jgi:hypothetical protein
MINTVLHIFYTIFKNSRTCERGCPRLRVEGHLLRHEGGSKPLRKEGKDAWSRMWRRPGAAVN